MKQIEVLDMDRINELKRVAMLRLQAVALLHRQIASMLRGQAEQHQAEAKRLIEDSKSLEVYK